MRVICMHVICVPEVCLRVIGVFVILERDVREISLCMIGVVICEVGFSCFDLTCM